MEEVEPTPWLERATTTGLIILATVPTDALVTYCGIFQRMASYAVGFIVLIWLISNLVVYLTWSALWALASKVFRKRAHFFGHLNTALLAGLAWTWIRISLEMFIFVFSADAYRSVPLFGMMMGIVSMTLWRHLRLVSKAPVRRLGGIAALISVFIIGLFFWARTLSFRRLPAMRTAEATMLPSFLRLAKPISLQKHLDLLGGLQAAVDARAKENN